MTGNVAIESMGGPILGFCGGRIDDVDGQASMPLGPSQDQMALSTCTVNGLCSDTKPLGPSTIGLIYVNPEGPINATGNPAEAAKDIRKVFGNMGFNDRETVALNGGGHAFGKFHGACAEAPGKGPLQNPTYPWPGNCGSGKLKGKAENTFTAGFEGQWTDTPTKWSNKAFTGLLEFDFKKEKSPGNVTQFKPVPKPGGRLPDPRVRFLVTDVAMVKDDVYLGLVKEYAHDIKALERDFAKAWYRLTSQDMGPRSRCTGPDVPPPQDFQDPLPDPPPIGASAQQLAGAEADLRVIAKDDTMRGLMATLAYNCAATYRDTSHLGGCNGGRVRFPPQVHSLPKFGAAQGLMSKHEMVSIEEF